MLGGCRCGTFQRRAVGPYSAADQVRAVGANGPTGHADAGGRDLHAALGGLCDLYASLPAQAQPGRTVLATDSTLWRAARTVRLQGLRGHDGPRPRALAV